MGKEKIRNLLIVGYTGGGKSTLADVLSNTQEYSKKNSQNVLSDIEEYPNKKDLFEWKGTKYRVVGVGNTKMIERVFHLIPEGISQVLFVIDGKFMAEKLLEKFNGIDKHITIVRTKFSNFKNEAERKKDKAALYKESEIIAKLSIVYVDNPPINISVYDEDDEETIRINQRRRDQSRAILLDHLEKVCHK